MPTGAADAGLIARQPSVTEVTPYAEVNGLVHFRQTSRPIQLLGLEASAVPAGCRRCSMRPVSVCPRAISCCCLRWLAESLNIQLGQRLTLIVPSAEGPTVAEAFTLAGVFATHTEIDQLLAIGALPVVADVAGIGG